MFAFRILITVLVSKNTIKLVVSAIFLTFQRTKVGILLQITKFYCEEICVL